MNLTEHGKQRDQISGQIGKIERGTAGGFGPEKFLNRIAKSLVRKRLILLHKAAVKHIEETMPQTPERDLVVSFIKESSNSDRSGLVVSSSEYCTRTDGFSIVMMRRRSMGVPITTASLGLATSGKISEVLVKEGDRVETNQVLIRLDSLQQAAAVAHRHPHRSDDGRDDRRGAALAGRCLFR